MRAGVRAYVRVCVCVCFHSRVSMKVSLHVVLPILTVLFSVRPWYACAVELNGAGASFPYDVYSAWMPAYKAHRRPFRHLSMRYESIGSGGGKARIKVHSRFFFLSPPSLHNHKVQEKLINNGAAGVLLISK